MIVSHGEDGHEIMNWALYVGAKWIQEKVCLLGNFVIFQAMVCWRNKNQVNKYTKKEKDANQKHFLLFEQ